jgi:hypothetical protein
LTTQGYQDTRDIEFDDSLWESDARNAQGKKVGRLVDPDDGSGVAVEQD